LAACAPDRPRPASTTWTSPRLQPSETARPASALFAGQPAQVKLTTLAALCTALQCGPGDLFDIHTTPVERPAGLAPAARAVAADQPQAVRGRSMPPI
jgi:hypothetical protein